MSSRPEPSRTDSDTSNPSVQSRGSMPLDVWTDVARTDEVTPLAYALPAPPWQSQLARRTADRLDPEQAAS